MTNAEQSGAFLVWHSGFVINSSFDIRASPRIKQAKPRQQIRLFTRLRHFTIRVYLSRRSLGEGGFVVTK